MKTVKQILDTKGQAQPPALSKGFPRRTLRADRVRELPGKAVVTMAGKRATGLVAVRDDLINAGAEYVDEPAVRDGNIITSRAPNDLPEFCQEIIKALTE